MPPTQSPSLYFGMPLFKKIKTSLLALSRWFFKQFKRSSWRARTPIVIQMEAVECGAASLGIVLGYYKKFVSLADLRYQCSVTRDGSNMLNIVQAAEFYGLEASGVRFPIHQLESLRKPAILLFDSSHYVVLEGFKKNKVYINDPEYGPICHKKEAFFNHYSGIAILLEPSSHFKKSEFKVGAWQRLKKIGYQHLMSYFFLLLNGCLLLLPALATLVTLRVFINYLYQSNVFLWKEAYLTCFAIAMGFGLFSLFLQSHVLKKISHKLSLHASSNALRSLLTLPLSFYQQRHPDDMERRLEIIKETNQSFNEVLVPLAIELILSAFYALLMFFYSPFIALVVLFGVAICLILQEIISRHRLALYDTYERDLKLSQAFSVDRLQHIEVIKMAGTESVFFRKWLNQYTHFLNTEQVLGKREIFLFLFPFFIRFFCISLLIGVGSYEILTGHLSLGGFAALQFLLILFLSPLKKMTLLSEKIHQMMRDTCRIDDLIHTLPDKLFRQRNSSSLQKNPFLSSNCKKPRLEFKQVDFSYYPFSPPFLKQIEFSLKPNEWLGLKGPTGSGKSTIGKLSAALYHPIGGHIFYGGEVAEDIDREIFRSSVGWVGEEPFLFAGPYQDNLTFWDNQISEDELKRVEEISDFKRKKWIEEKGKNLSLGERQQIEMMRLLLKKPSLLIIDNGIHALEISVQKKILHAFRLTGCSCLLITSQVAILDLCDHILEIKKGEILR